MANKILNAKGKTHCRYFVTRPQQLDKMMLCSGSGFCDPCPDLAQCRLIRPKPIQPPKERVRRRRVDLPDSAAPSS